MFKVGDRVKRVRRGCAVSYGTVVQAEQWCDMDNSQSLRIDWDHSGISWASSREVKLVKIDRSWKALHGGG